LFVYSYSILPHNQRLYNAYTLNDVAELLVDSTHRFVLLAVTFSIYANFTLPDEEFPIQHTNSKPETLGAVIATLLLFAGKVTSFHLTVIDPAHLILLSAIPFSAWLGDYAILMASI
jgi:hypothetical protein